MVQVSNDYLTFECTGVGAFSPSLATVTRAATTNFSPATASGFGAGNAATQDDSGLYTDPIIAIVLIAIVALLALFVFVRGRQQQKRSRAKPARPVPTAAASV